MFDKPDQCQNQDNVKTFSFYPAEKRGVNTPNRSCYINNMLKRLDQGHLHPKLEVPGQTCPGQKSNLGLHVGGRACL